MKSGTVTMILWGIVWLGSFLLNLGEDLDTVEAYLEQASVLSGNSLEKQNASTQEQKQTPTDVPSPSEKEKTGTVAEIPTTSEPSPLGIKLWPQSQIRIFEDKLRSEAHIDEEVDHVLEELRLYFGPNSSSYYKHVREVFRAGEDLKERLRARQEAAKQKN